MLWPNQIVYRIFNICFLILNLILDLFLYKLVPRRHMCPWIWDTSLNQSVRLRKKTSMRVVVVWSRLWRRLNVTGSCWKWIARKYKGQSAPVQHTHHHWDALRPFHSSHTTIVKNLPCGRNILCCMAHFALTTLICDVCEFLLTRRLLNMTDWAIWLFSIPATPTPDNRGRC